MIVIDAGGRVLDASESVQALREREERFRTVADSMPAMIWMSDPDGRCVFANRACIDFTGRALEALVGDGWVESVHPDDRDKVCEAWHAAQAARRPLDLEYRLRRADGRYRWVQNRGVPRFLADGTCAGFVGAAADATDHRRALALQEGHRRVLELLATGASLEEVLGALVRMVETEVAGARAAVLLLEQRNTRLRVGAAPSLPRVYTEAIEAVVLDCARISASREEFRAIDDLESLPDRPLGGLVARLGLRCVWFQRVHTAGGGLLGTLAIYHPSSRRPEAWEAELIDASAHLAGIAIERKQAEGELARARDQALEAARLKAEFLANMSHEIRTPMNGIVGFTDFALETELTAEQREYLTTVRASAETLLALLNDVLDFSRLEAGKLGLEAAPFSLRLGLRDTLRAVGLRAAEKGLELVCDVPAEVGDAVVGDRGRLRQVVLNLLGNAVKFTERGEVVLRVRAEAAGEDDVLLHFEVADTGIGIPPEQQSLVFGAFVQGDGSYTRNYGGTGLGLAICVPLVERMQGRIWLESAVGRGSTFHFTARLGCVKGAPRIAGAAAELASVRVLVVDDNASSRDALERALSAHGASVIAVGDGLAALAALDRARAEGAPVALALLDAQMPGMDGFALAERMRQPGPPPPRLVLLASPGAQAGEARRARALGMSAVLAKPVLDVDLVETARTVLAAPVPEAVDGDAAGVLAEVDGQGERIARLVEVLRAGERLLVEMREGVLRGEPPSRDGAAERLRSLAALVATRPA